MSQLDDDQPEEEYLVRVEVDVQGRSVEEAALAAYEALRDPEALPWIVDVRPHGSEAWTEVDVEEVLKAKES